MRELAKSFIKTGTGSAGSIIFGTVAIKILAAMLGPAGVGLFSLMRQILSTVLSVATLSGQTALVQGGASSTNGTKLAYLGTVLRIYVISGAIASVAILVLAPVAAEKILGRTDSQAIAMIRFLAFPVMFAVLAGFASGVLNIDHALGKLAIVQTVPSLSLAVFAFPTALLFAKGFEVAFTGLLCISFLSSALLSLLFLHNQAKLKPILGACVGRISWNQAIRFLSFALVTAASALMVTGVMLAIRTAIRKELGINGVGIFEAAWTISMSYVMLVLSSFGTYYLPTLSRLARKEERGELITKVIDFSTLVIVPIIIAFVVLKGFIIKTLFSGEFSPALKIMRWMLIGDFLKITSWVLSYPMLAVADKKTFFWTETVSYSFLLFSCLASVIVARSLEGVGIAFLALYIFYLVGMFFYARGRHGFRLNIRTSLYWAAGLLLILSVSASAWNTTSVRWPIDAIWIGLGCAFSWFAMGRTRRGKIVSIICGKLRDLPIR